MFNGLPRARKELSPHAILSKHGTREPIKHVHPHAMFNVNVNFKVKTETHTETHF
jgi:hypothetical protein